ncbi:MAG: class I SAM-dependent methyltransferase [Anaerolineales bacterium]|nr:class I SAM-dependent methyltransferase [Anaerolineales bacterium]
MNKKKQSTAESYDRVAEYYAEHFIHELDGKPFDRYILKCFSDYVGPEGKVLDIGCGPGQITKYLHDLGANVSGSDLSPQMIDKAKEIFPEIPFFEGDMADLQLPDESLVGITAFYSIIHIEQQDHARVLAEFNRLLAPGGYLLYCFHMGDKTLHLDEWVGNTVDLDFYYFTQEEMEGKTREAGFTILESITRRPYPGVEAETSRCYILAQKKFLLINNM